MNKQKKEPTNSEMKRALADMVWYFAPHTGKDDEQLTTGGIIALEHAFHVLGLPDPITKMNFIKMYETESE